MERFVYRSFKSRNDSDMSYAQCCILFRVSKELILCQCWWMCNFLVISSMIFMQDLSRVPAPCASSYVCMAAFSDSHGAQEHELIVTTLKVAFHFTNVPRLRPRPRGKKTCTRLFRGRTLSRLKITAVTMERQKVSPSRPCTVSVIWNKVFNKIESLHFLLHCWKFFHGWNSDSRQERKQNI